MSYKLPKGNIDLHVHSLPDIRERAYTDFDLMEAGIKAGTRAIVIKSHHGFTMNRAFLVNEHNRIVHGNSNDFEMFGSITLNYAIGGLNPIAVETGLKLGAKCVWLPTIHAKNHMEKFGKSGGIECIDENGEVVEDLVRILELVKEYDVILGTAHCSPQEIFAVVKKARELGIEKIVVTHPEFWVVGMSHEDQVRIVKEYDVMLERCYAQPMGGGVYQSNLSDNLDIIKKVGSKNIIVDTDGGQVENPNWEIAFGEYVNYLVDHGITEDEIYDMTVRNGSKMLNIEVMGENEC